MTQDYRISDVQNATYNGRKVKVFKAYRREGHAYIYCGTFSAPQRTAIENLHKFIDEDHTP